ncbi:MAG: M3 family oligoendopeptidase, partial [Cytophagia bacterium]|nr:M3 family oligoendopeptidase [Cytophagia bacterium]
MGIKLNSKKRSFLPLTISLENWEDIKSFYEELQQRQINSAEDQHTWLADRSEIDAFVSEDLAWRYIKFTCNTLDEDIKKRYDYFINEIQPHLAPISDQLNRKFIDFYNVESAPSEAYQILYRSIKNSIELFREKNIPLYTTIANEGQKYARITSKMMIEHEGAELTLQQAAAFLEKPDREIRKQVFDKVVDARLKDAAEIDELYSTLVKLRQEVA